MSEIEQRVESVQGLAPQLLQDHPFIGHLVRMLRAEDLHGSWDAKSDLEILEPYLLTPEKRAALPLLGEPDPETLWYMEIYYATVSMALEQATGIMASSLMKMHYEGFGRLVLIAGRLVVVNRYLRDVHRFGFASVEQLAASGQSLVDEAIAMVETYPAVAHYGADEERIDGLEKPGITMLSTRC